MELCRVEMEIMLKTKLMTLAVVALHGITIATGFGQSTTARPDKGLPWVTSKVAAPRLEFRTFDSGVVGTKISYHIYTPKAYDNSKARLPVLYWLHGTGGGVNGVLPLVKHFERAMGDGKIPPMIVVFVNGLPRRLWSDSKDGSAPVETVVITELIPHIDKNFRTIAAREGRILEGFSMGGYGAGRLGFKHSNLFTGISMLAGGPLDLEFQGPRARQNVWLRELILREVCSGDLDYFKKLSPWVIAETTADKLRSQKLVIRQAVGDKDFTLDNNDKFHQRLTQLKIAHDFIVLPNVGHDVMGLLEGLGERSGKFYRDALGVNNAGVEKK